jgi:hypothetical protein
MSTESLQSNVRCFFIDLIIIIIIIIVVVVVMALYDDIVAPTVQNLSGSWMSECSADISKLCLAVSQKFMKSQIFSSLFSLSLNTHSTSSYMFQQASSVVWRGLHRIATCNAKQVHCRSALVHQIYHNPKIFNFKVKKAFS